MLSISKAGDDIAALMALRDRIAMEIDATSDPQIVAVLSRQFLAVVERLADLKPTAPSKVDEIAEKYSQKLRSIRGSDTPNKAPSRRQKQSG